MRSIAKRIKERPLQKPQIGDRVILRHKNSEYHPGILVDVVRKNRNKLIATIEWPQFTPPNYNKRTAAIVPKKKCNYIDLTVIRDDYWWEKLGNYLGSKFKRDPWAKIHKR